jgi:hypothetical protein
MKTGRNWRVRLITPALLDRRIKRRKFRQIMPNGDSAAGQVRAIGLQPANRSVDISALRRALRDGRNRTQFISFAAVLFKHGITHACRTSCRRG